jgi:N-acetylmuramoyl-L-alanine amidase
MPRSTAFFLLLFLVLSTPGFSLAQASSAANRAVTNPTSQAEELYKSAKDIYYRLERNPGATQDRAQWLYGIRNFRKIYLADPAGKLAPSCLYMIARMYRRMYQQFKLPIDIDEAVSHFNDVATIFPGSSLADDALYTVGEIELKEKNNPRQAALNFRLVITRYPQGDRANEAISQLETIARRHDIKLPEKIVKAQTGRDLVTLQPIQHWSSNDYTRIVIRASGPVHYTTSLLEKNNNQPRRLYIDFNQSYVPPEARAPVPIQDGLLRQVRTGQFNDTTARVVLDIESISDYKIFSLKDPFRVIVDVRGEKKEGTATADRAQTPAAKAPPEKNAPPTIGPEQVPASRTQTKAEVFITLQDQKKVKPSQSTSSRHKADGGAISLAQQLGLGIRRIVIDPGHGGKDPGAMAFNLKEKDIVLNVALRTSAILKKKYHYDVVLTRDTDTFIPLEERTAIANTNNADLFVSVHVNAHPKKTAKGVETFYLNLATNTEAMRVAARENATSTHNISEMQGILSDLMQNSKIRESSQLAESVQSSLIRGLKKKRYTLKNLGVKQAPFYVLIGAEMPAVLAEISFITNPEEARLLQKDSYLQTIAEQIAAGVAAYGAQRRTAALQL